MPHAPRPVTIARFDTPSEAAVVQALLEADGIRVHAADEGLLRLDWSFSQAVGGIRLMVPEDRAEDALALVNAYRRGDTALIDEDPDTMPADACGRCGSRDVDARVPTPQKLLLVALSLFPGALFPTRQSALRCRTCGHEWQIPP